MKNELKIIRGNLNFLLKSLGTKVKNVKIPSIPSTWEKFPGSNTNDEWIALPDISKQLECSSCLYKGFKGSEFSPHKHKDNTELITILNKNGKIRVITPNDDVVLSFPASCVFDKDEPHMVYFLEDTTIQCVWRPAFKKGWIADFNE